MCGIRFFADASLHGTDCEWHAGNRSVKCCGALLRRTHSNGRDRRRVFAPAADGRPSGRIKVALNRPESQRRTEEGGENGDGDKRAKSSIGRPQRRPKRNRRRRCIGGIAICLLPCYIVASALVHFIRSFSDSAAVLPTLLT
jgi:hypothetical protein